MKLKLLRLATLYFNPAPNKGVTYSIQSDEVGLRILDTSELDGKLRLLVGAVVPLSTYPDLNAENSVIIPNDAQRAAETAIETFANLVSIGEMCSRSISSPTPWVVLLPQDDVASSWLENKNGIAQSTSLETWFRFPIESDVLQALTRDRLQGAALLSEALSYTHPTGQLHEYVRVFELAFRTASTPLVVPLACFLSGNSQGYTEDEVKHWITTVRPQATHADLQQQSKFVLAAEVRPIISRVRQAAFDVLFNKAEWHNPTTTRRDLWKPMAFVGTPDKKTWVITQGSTPIQESQLIDGFGSYPIDLSAGISPIPDDWWCKQPSKHMKEDQ